LLHNILVSKGMFYLNLLLLGRIRYLLNILHTWSTMAMMMRTMMAMTILNEIIGNCQIDILSVGLYLRRYLWHLLFWDIYNHSWVHVFTLFTLTILPTLNPCLKTFTILLDTMRFFTITSLYMFRCHDSIIKALRILV
jgi:hypothetical protein